MSNKFLSIGKTAKLMNVTVKALRYYDKIGLLRPGYIDPESNYRYYNFDQLICIDLIKAARKLDISPNALVPCFAEKDTDQLVELMRIHKVMLSEKLKQLAKTLEQIETIERILKTAEHTDKSGGIYIRELPDRFVVTQPFPIEQAEEEILLSFYQLIASLNQRNLTYLYEDGIIYSIDEATIRPESIYASVINEDSLRECRLLPGGRYLCTALHRDNAEEQYSKLLDYTLKQGLKPQFIYQTELITDFFSDAPAYVEAQIRIDG